MEAATRTTDPRTFYIKTFSAKSDAIAFLGDLQSFDYKEQRRVLHQEHLSKMTVLPGVSTHNDYLVDISCETGKCSGTESALVCLSGWYYNYDDLRRNLAILSRGYAFRCGKMMSRDPNYSEHNPHYPKFRLPREFTVDEIVRSGFRLSLNEQDELNYIEAINVCSRLIPVALNSAYVVSCYC